MHPVTVATEIAEAFAHAPHLRLFEVQRDEVPDHAAHAVDLQLVAPLFEQRLRGVALPRRELAQLVEVVGRVPEVDDTRRLLEAVGADVPDPLRAVGHDDEGGPRPDAELAPRLLQRGGERGGAAEGDEVNGGARQPAVPAPAVALHQEERPALDLPALRRAVLALHPLEVFLEHPDPGHVHLEAHDDLAPVFDAGRRAFQSPSLHVRPHRGHEPVDGAGRDGQPGSQGQVLGRLEVGLAAGGLVAEELRGGRSTAAGDPERLVGGEAPSPVRPLRVSPRVGHLAHAREDPRLPPPAPASRRLHTRRPLRGARQDLADDAGREPEGGRAHPALGLGEARAARLHAVGDGQALRDQRRRGLVVPRGVFLPGRTSPRPAPTVPPSARPTSGRSRSPV